MAKNPDFPKLQVIVCAGVKDHKKVNWAREMLIAKKLLAQYPNVDYWGVFAPEWKPLSLSYWLGDKGQRILATFFTGGAGLEALEKKRRVDALEIPKQETYNLQTENVVTPTVTPAKPKTLKDFLKE